MPALRALLIRHPLAIAVLLAAALAMKLLVPAGFMPVRTAGTMVVAICNGIDTHAIAIDLNTGEQNPADDRADQPCSFGGCTPLGLPAADPLLIALGIAFLLALGFAEIALPRLASRRQLRPPLRGPPPIF